MGNAALRVCLTYHEAHEFVGKDARADESHPQADVKFPGALRLHPHKQADEGKQTSVKRALIKYNDTIPQFLTFLFSPTRLPSCQRGSGRSIKAGHEPVMLQSVWTVL